MLTTESNVSATGPVLGYLAKVVGPQDADLVQYLIASSHFVIPPCP
jgi:hypothetical protein